MPHAQALVLTNDPSAPAAALAQRLRHEFDTEWSAEAGFVKLDEGICTFHSWPEGLRLDAFADSPGSLTRLETFIGDQLASESGLRVVWRRRPSSVN